MIGLRGSWETEIKRAPEFELVIVNFLDKERLAKSLSQPPI